MTIRTLLMQGVEQLRSSGLDNARNEAEWLLAHAIGKDRIHLYAYGEEPVDRHAREAFLESVRKRTSGYPFQYILGTAEFMGLQLFVDESVLIPRPETELLAQMAIDELTRLSDNDNNDIESTKEGRYGDGCKRFVLDVGTGSGALAISIAKARPEAHIVAADCSHEALHTAKRNADHHGVADRITFLQGDLFGALRAETSEPLSESFDLIVSNPPYIATDVIETLAFDVRNCEPRLALDGGEDGLDIVRRLVAGASGYLRSGGLLLVEIGCDQGARVLDVIRHENGAFLGVHIEKDLAGCDRFAVARRR